MVSFILDAVLIILCIIVVTVSVRQGFVKTVLSIVSSFASVLVSVTLTPYAAGFIYDKYLLGYISGGIKSTVLSLTDGGSSEGIAKMFSDMPEVLSRIFARYNVGDDAVTSMSEEAALGSLTVDGICDIIASPIASVLSNVIAFVVCFIVTVILLKIIIYLVDRFFDLPVLKSINKAVGFLFGILLSALIVFVYSAVVAQLVTALGAISPDFFGADVIADTVVVQFFSDYNLFWLIKEVLQKNYIA